MINTRMSGRRLYEPFAAFTLSRTMLPFNSFLRRCSRGRFNFSLSSTNPKLGWLNEYGFIPVTNRRNFAPVTNPLIFGRVGTALISEGFEMSATLRPFALRSKLDSMKIPQNSRAIKSDFSEERPSLGCPYSAQLSAQSHSPQSWGL